MKSVKRSLADLTAMVLQSTFLNSAVASLRLWTSSWTVVAELVDNMDNRPLMVAIPVGVPDNIHCRNSDTAVCTFAILVWKQKTFF